MGNNWEEIQSTLHNFDMLMLVLVIATVVWYVWRHLKHRRAKE
jgi:hypothetical protein